MYSPEWPPSAWSWTSTVEPAASVQVHATTSVDTRTTVLLAQSVYFAAFGSLLTHSLLVRLRTPASIQPEHRQSPTLRRQPITWLLLAGLLLQLCIGGYCARALNALVQRDALAANTWNLDVLPIALFAASATAAVANIISLLLGDGSTARAVYHLCTASAWTWINSADASLRFGQEEVLDIGLAILFPWLFAIAFLLDVFHAPANRHHVLLPSTAYSGIDQLSYRWLSLIIDTKATLSQELLPENPSLAPSEDYLAALRLAAHDVSNSGSSADTLFWQFIRRQHARELAFATLLRLFCDLSVFAIPWQLRALLQRPTNVNVMALFCSRALGALAGNYSGLYLRSLSVRYRSALCVLLHNKTLALGDARPKTPAPDLAVLAEVDTMTLYRCAQAYPDVWTFPFQVFLCLGGLAYILPWQAFLAVVILIALASPVLGMMLRSMAFWISANMSAKDERATLVGEVLNSITAIKMHAWESVLARLVAERRREELKTLQRSALSASGLVTYMQSMPAALTIVAFGVMLLLHVPLTNGLIFTLIILFTMLNASLTQFSTLASNVQLVKTSATRIVSYLHLSQDNINVELDGLSGSRAWSKDTALTTNIMRVGWPGSNVLISSGSLAVPPGSLSAITGSMGSGKSTLLLALAREAQKRHRVAYVGQKPVMIGGSLRDNILFGQPYDARRYNRVIHACCLDTDFANLRHGDSTLVASTSALSGGQCARICLARAAYSQADLFALDDPLAALDVRVSATIVRRLLGPTGLLGRSTRIICTSHPLVLAQATFTYLIENGSLRTVESKDSHLDELLLPPGKSPQTRDPPVFEVSKPIGADVIETNAPLAKLVSFFLTLGAFIDFLPGPNYHQAPIVDVHVAEESLEGGSMAPLNEEPTNEKATSANPQGALYGYLSSCKKLGWPIALGVLLLARMSSVSGTYVLKILATQTSETDLFRCLGLFGILSLSQGACFYIFVYTLYALCIVPAATMLHTKLTAGVLRRDLSYFQTTPSANILNLFTNDVGRVDGSLNGSLASLAGQYVNLILSCGVLITAMPVSALFVVPLMAACHYIQRAYLVKLRQLRHLDAESRAPLLECLQEAESGRVLFSMHGMQERRKDEFDGHIAFNVRAVWPLACTDLWIAVRLEILSIVLQVAAAGALLASSAEPGILGFVMTYVFQVTGTLSNIAKVTTQFESDAVSVTRIAEASDRDMTYMIDAPEASTALFAPYSDNDPDQAWPQNGRIEFRSVSARHRPGLPDSLNSISFTVNPGEKVAIIGRTGAGKSSMVLALLKLMDQTAGQILVDDVDVSIVGEVRLRTSLAVVPQTQLIFSGTVRQNLDPLGFSDDGRILEALRICGGLSIVHKMLGVGEEMVLEDAALLDTVVGPKSNLSKGELQLLLLGRAVVQRSKVLIMDEATSGMDAAGEARCHDVIFGELLGTTTLAVLHRLELTLHYDKVLVLDHGKVAAFDTPAVLLRKGEGPYYDMIAESAELLEQAMNMYGTGH